jgi:hypothetical protein
LVVRVFQTKSVQDEFLKVVDKAFEKFLNIEPNIVAEYLAKFLDLNMKKG